MMMTATKIDGTAIAKRIREKIQADIAKAQDVRMKVKAAEEAQITCNLAHYREYITEPELLQNITRFNNDPTVHGILVQLPIPRYISEHTITSAVAEEKDVDGFGASNIGELAKRGGRPLFVPCTPKGVMVILEGSGADLKGKDVVVLGRSNIVGSPVEEIGIASHQLEPYGAW